MNRGGDDNDVISMLLLKIYEKATFDEVRCNRKHLWTVVTYLSNQIVAGNQIVSAAGR